MRVVHVITGLATGGAERMLQQRIARTRHNAQVVVLSVEGEIGAQLRAAGVPVHHVGMRSNRDLPAVFALARLLRRLKADVVHVHLYRSLVYGRLAARIAGLPVIATEHSAQEHSTEGREATRTVRSLYRLTERLGTVTVAVSSTTRSILIRFWGIPAERIVVVPNGIDTDRLRITEDARSRSRQALGLPENARLVVGAGRLVEGKRFDVLIDAVDRLGPQAHVLIAGEGPERAALQQRAVSAGVADRVHLVGVVDDILDVLAPADLFASASVVETYGIAIMEAYVAGLPVVYTQCPAVHDLLGDTESARLIRSRQDAASFAAAITTGLGQPVGAQYVDPVIRDRVDIDRVNDQLDELEAQVASRAGPSRR